MATVNYIWDPLADSYLMETDGSGSTQAVYTVEPDLYGRVVSQRRGSDHSFYHFDGLGSTRELTNSSETVTDTNMHDAWGVNRASTGATLNPFEYLGEVGYYHDTETSELYLRNRTYDSSIARWTTVDSIVSAVLTAQSPYAANCPTRDSDPSAQAANAHLCYKKDPKCTFHKDTGILSPTSKACASLCFVFEGQQTTLFGPAANLCRCEKVEGCPPRYKCTTCICLWEFKGRDFSYRPEQCPSIDQLICKHEHMHKKNCPCTKPCKDKGGKIDLGKLCTPGVDQTECAQKKFLLDECALKKKDIKCLEMIRDDVKEKKVCRDNATGMIKDAKQFLASKCIVSSSPMGAT
jgi:RHS repeat-associated protein